MTRSGLGSIPRNLVAAASITACTSAGRQPAEVEPRAPAQVELAPNTLPSTGARTRTLAIRNPTESVTIAAAPARENPPPLGSHRLVDVDFHRADLENALRLLADAGAINLVVDGPLTGEVSLKLRSVRPFDALITVAEASGVTVRRRDDVLIVSAQLAGTR